jgi:biotin transport system substrate-specific component
VRLGGRPPVWWRTALGCLVGGVLVIYAFGIPVQSLVTDLPLGETAVTSMAFLPGDLLKTVAATIVTMTLWRAYPRAFGDPSRANPRSVAP